MNQPTQEQIDRLPKWAQDHIRDLRRTLEDSLRAVLELTQDRQTATYWTTGIRDERKYIPDNARIYIERPNDRHTLVVHWDKQREMLNVASEFSSLILRPHSSNWIHVRSE